MKVRTIAMALVISASLPGQDQDAKPRPYVVPTGTRVPLSLLNSVSSRNAAEGDRIYLETTYPIVVEGKIVIPPGSHVAGTVTQVKRAGKVKGRGEIYVRFDSLLLPSGVSREFKSRLGAIDGSSSQQLDRDEGKVVADGSKGRDAAIIAGGAMAGAGLGTAVGRGTQTVTLGENGAKISSGAVKGLGMGAAAGAAAGLVVVLFTRGPEAVLARGSSVEMVLDRDLEFVESELGGTSVRRPAGPAPAAGEPAPRTRLPGRGLPR